VTQGVLRGVDWGVGSVLTRDLYVERLPPRREAARPRLIHPPRVWSSPSRTPASSSRHSWSPRRPSRFSAAPNAYAPTTEGSASVWPSSRASPEPTTEPSPSRPALVAVSASPCNSPKRRRASWIGSVDRAASPFELPSSARTSARSHRCVRTRTWSAGSRVRLIRVTLAPGLARTVPEASQ
jgi:hypothetical protein